MVTLLGIYLDHKLNLNRTCLEYAKQLHHNSMCEKGVNGLLPLMKRRSRAVSILIIFICLYSGISHQLFTCKKSLQDSKISSFGNLSKPGRSWCRLLAVILKIQNVHNTEN